MSSKPTVPLINVGGTELLGADTPEMYRQKLARITLDSMVQFVALLDAQGTVLDINKAALDAVGIELSDVEGKPFWTTCWWQASDEIRATLRESLERASRGEFVRWDTEIFGRAGGKETIIIDASLRPVKDDQGKVVLITAEGRDTTEKQKHEREHAALASSLLGAIVDSCDDAIISKDLNGVITSWNRSAERLFGYTAEEAVGQAVTILIPPERLDEEPKILERLRRGERVDHFETIRVRKDGSRLNISLTISPVKDADDRIVGASKVARDITERVQHEEALRELNAALTRANADLQQFAYSASHDLQEPLRMVTVYSQLLQRRFGGQLGSAGEEMIRHTIEGAKRMENLLKDLRTYTHVSTSEHNPTEEIEASEALEKALSNLAVTIKDSGATISSSTLPCVHIHKFQLEQVFQNLIGNAIRYRGDQSPRVDISAERRGDVCMFSVRDNGIGIDPQFREQIFGIFKRLHSAADYPGTGMGLAICQRIIERVGGRIWVESESGKGSTFYFTVPCSRLAAEAS
jgi:PAS domain S-box-containing protein